MSLLVSDQESSSSWSSVYSPQPTSPKAPKQSTQTKEPSEEVELHDTDKKQSDEIDHRLNVEKEKEEWTPHVRQQKVPIRLQAIGSTAAIQPSSFNVAGTQNIASIAKYIMKKLRLKSVHVYVSSSFEPTPEESLSDLYESFKTNNVLNLSYCETIAFG